MVSNMSRLAFVYLIAVFNSRCLVTQGCSSSVILFYFYFTGNFKQIRGLVTPCALRDFGSISISKFQTIIPTQGVSILCSFD